jgi:hypothetical protein
MAKQGRIRNIGSTDGGIIFDDETGRDVGPFIEPLIGSMMVGPNYLVNYTESKDANGKFLATEVRPVRKARIDKLEADLKVPGILSGTLTDEVTRAQYPFRIYVDPKDKKDDDVAVGTRVRYELLTDAKGISTAIHVTATDNQKTPKFLEDLLGAVAGSSGASGTK